MDCRQLVARRHADVWLRGDVADWMELTITGGAGDAARCGASA